MKMLRIALATAVVAACGLLTALTPAAAATYGSVSLHITDNHTCCGTGDVTVQITSDPSGVVCTTLTVSASNGARVYKGGSRAPSQTFTNVKTPFTVKIFVNPDDEDWSATTQARCLYDDTQVPQSLGDISDASTGDAAALRGGGLARSVALVAATQQVESSGVLDKTACPDPSDGSDSDNSDSDSSDSDSSDSDDSDDGGLPNTGGARMLWLVVGLLLLAGGATVVIQSRRKGGAER